jgi:hypothetical protein
MNERVGKLWDQAASECAYLRSGENSWDTQVRFIDKFAELLIREYSYDVMDITGEPERVAICAKNYWGVEL